MKLPANAYICFHEDCYHVRFYKSENGKCTTVKQKIFSDREKAVKWRDENYKRLLARGQINPCRLVSATIPAMSNNKTGVTGVFYINRYENKKKKGKRPFMALNHSFNATWIEYFLEEGVIKRRARRKAFSVEKYGKDEAFRMACEYRKKMEKFLNLPENLFLRKIYKTQTKG